MLSGKPLFPGKNAVHQLDLMTDFLDIPPPESHFKDGWRIQFLRFWRIPADSVLPLMTKHQDNAASTGSSDSQKLLVLLYLLLMLSLLLFQLLLPVSAAVAVVAGSAGADASVGSAVSAAFAGSAVSDASAGAAASAVAVVAAGAAVAVGSVGAAGSAGAAGAAELLGEVPFLWCCSPYLLLSIFGMVILTYKLSPVVPEFQCSHVEIRGIRIEFGDW